MLSTSSISILEELAKDLAAKGVVLAPMPQSPVGALTDACYSPRLDTGESGLGGQLNSADFIFASELFQASTLTDASGAVKHDVVMEELTNTIATAVGRTLDMARNVVNPVIKQVVSSVEDYVANASTVATTPYTIRSLFPSKLWDGSIVSDLVDKFVEVPISDVRLNIALGPLTEEEIISKMQSGVSRFDSSLKEVIAGMPAGAVVDLYNSLFVPSSGVQVQGGNFTQFLATTKDQDLILLVHLLCRSMASSAPKDTQSTLEDYRAFIASLVEQSGRAICRLLEKAANDKRTKRLVAQWPTVDAELAGKYPEQAEIIVNGPVYNEWLAAGGSPEIIFGAAISDRNGNYDGLLTMAADYKTAWTRQERVLSTAGRFARLNNYERAFDVAVNVQINLLESDADRLMCRTLLEKNLFLIDGESTKNLYRLAQLLVCRSMFPHTQAEMILSAIDAECTANPELDVREAGLLAVIEIVSNWLFQFILVSKAV